MNQDERREEAAEARLRELLETVRDERPARPELRDAVMSEIAALPSPAWRRAIDWLLQPREIRVRPATAGAALAVAVAVLAILPMGDADSPAPPGGGAADATTDPASVAVTRFVFIAPEAASVSLTGDFVGWAPSGIPLTEQRGNGVWTIDVPLDPGIYEYAFVIDGQEWRPDPLATTSVDDGFGRENSVVIVAGGRT